MRFLRLTDLYGNLQLINLDHVDSFYLSEYKGQMITKVGLSAGVFLPVRETISEISLLLQSNDLIIQ